MNRSLEDLAVEFVKYAELHGKATEDGDSKAANRLHGKLGNVIKEIRLYHEEGSAELLRLIDHKNDFVRCWAATCSLQYSPAKSVKTLEDLIKQHGPVALDAELILDGWRKGTVNPL